MSSRDDNSLPHLLYALSIIFSVLPTIVVALRFQVKTKSNPRIFLDDWLILLALISCIVYAVFVIIGVAAGGLGRPLKRNATGEPIYDDEFFLFQKVSFVTNFVQMIALGPTKLAVLLLYRRIFGVDRRGFNIISTILMGLVITWTGAFVFTNIFTYTPIEDMWTKPPGKAHATFKHPTAMYNSQCFADMVLDIFIIVLPLPQIWKLHMTVRLKIQISCIFMLGLITVGASVARAVIQYGVAAKFAAGNPDQTYYLCPGTYWALIEISVGIIAASLPLLRRIGQIYPIGSLMTLSIKVLSSIFTNSSQNSSQSTERDASNRELLKSTSYPSHGHDSQTDKWLRQYDISCLQHTIDHQCQIESNPTSGPSNSLASDGINYEKSYEVVHAARKDG